jgi:hypothetical protein
VVAAQNDSDGRRGSRCADDGVLPTSIKLTLTLEFDSVVGKRLTKLGICQTLTPNHTGKPHKTLWVDTQTSLVLKREVRHADGSPARVASFSEITFAPKTPRAQFEFKPSAGTKVVSATSSSQCKNRAEAQKFIAARSPLPDRLPSLGFKLRSAFCRQVLPQLFMKSSPLVCC